MQLWWSSRLPPFAAVTLLSEEVDTTRLEPWLEPWLQTGRNCYCEAVFNWALQTAQPYVTLSTAHVTLANQSDLALYVACSSTFMSRTSQM